jgi:hypothetical protein
MYLCKLYNKYCIWRLFKYGTWWNGQYGWHGKHAEDDEANAKDAKGYGKGSIRAR